MSMTFATVAHIAGGGTALVAGGMALLTKKGAAKHRLAGQIFAISMLVMTLFGAWIAWFDEVAISVLAGLLSFYLVVSGWLTVSRSSSQFTFQKYVPLLIGLPVLLLGIHQVNQAMQGEVDNIDGFIVPVAVYVSFTLVLSIGVIGDLLWAFRSSASRPYQLSRHIWRLCVSLYIAASSFFEGQADVFPVELQYSIYLSIPQNLVFLMMLFWLLKMGIERFRARTAKRKSENVTV